MSKNIYCKLKFNWIKKLYALLTFMKKVIQGYDFPIHFTQFVASWIFIKT